MNKNLTSKIHLKKKKLFLHILHDGGTLLTRIFEFIELLSHLTALEIKHDDEDLGLIIFI